MNSAKRILFSANDPGGANAILSVVVALNALGDSVHGILTGPALEMFHRAGISCDDGAVLSESDLVRKIDALKPDLFLAASSIGNSIDKRILRALKDVPSVYVIDFWSHYGHRFSKVSERDPMHLPTRICVIDERMKREMLGEGFPEERIRVTGNPHFDHFAEDITREKEDSSCAVFISQPIRKDKKEDGYVNRGFDEFEVLEKVIANLPTDLYLSIRLHPREERDTFNSYLSDRIQIAPEPTLEEALSKAGLVIGMFSPVLMQAAFAGKPTVSFQPGSTGDDPLPTNALGLTQLAKNEEELRSLIQKYQERTFPQSKQTADNLWPKDATERVVAVIDSLLT